MTRMPSSVSAAQDLRRRLGVAHDRALGDLDLERLDRAGRAASSSRSISRCSRRSCSTPPLTLTATATSWPSGAPARALADREVEDVQRQRPHDVGRLDQRDEVVGRDGAAARVVPAHERLGGGRPARVRRARSAGSAASSSSRSIARRSSRTTSTRRGSYCASQRARRAQQRRQREQVGEQRDDRERDHEPARARGDVVARSPRRGASARARPRPGRPARRTTGAAVTSSALVGRRSSLDASTSRRRPARERAAIGPLLDLRADLRAVARVEDRPVARRRASCRAAARACARRAAGGRARARSRAGSRSPARGKPRREARAREDLGGVGRALERLVLDLLVDDPADHRGEEHDDEQRDHGHRRDEAPAPPVAHPPEHGAYDMRVAGGRRLTGGLARAAGGEGARGRGDARRPRRRSSSRPAGPACSGRSAA